MGYAVLHLLKSKGGSLSMSAHIERTVAPANADPERTHLNRELIEFPDGVTSRTEAIKHRLDTVGLKRKIGKNQVTDFNIILSGTSEDMNKIAQQGKLNDWCSDNIDWLNETYGADNVVSAVLHLDEKTPHIHATVVPIVTTERKRRKREEHVKKQYRKKSATAPRLCVDEVMSRDKLKEYQNTYAQAMAKYGLQRGIEGSEARHISTNQFYREVFHQTEVEKENLSKLEQQQSEAQENLSKVKSDIRKENFKNSAADVGATLLDGVSSILGSGKTKQQQHKIEALEVENNYLHQEIERVKGIAKDEINKRHDQYMVRESELKEENNKLKETLGKIYDFFPYVKEMLHLEGFIRKVGFGTDMIKRLFNREEVGFRGKIYSYEHKRDFETESSTAKLEPDPTPDRPHKFRLTIDRLDIYDWFHQKHKEFLHTISINIKEPKQNRGHRM